MEQVLMSDVPSNLIKVPSEIPSGCQVLCIGEAPGRNERDFRRPFIGGSGQLLRWALKQVGFDDSTPVGFTNVLPYHPPENKLNLFCIPRPELASLDCPSWYKHLPATIPGKIIHPGLGVPALEDLQQLIDDIDPRIIIALGNTACWAILRQTGIERIRGAPHWDHPIAREDNVPSHKVIATYHPAAVLRNYKILPILLLDLLKARNEMDTRRIVWPERWLEIAPSRAVVARWMGAMAGDGVLPHPVRHPAPRASYVAVDVETERKPGPHITLIGFAPRSDLGLVIPFINPLAPDRSNFNKTDEKQIILHIRSFLENHLIRKCFHNCLYDLPWLHSYGINPQNAYHDTMLMSHALWPEMRKSLRMLGSILTQERNWKFLRAKSSKRED